MAISEEHSSGLKELLEKKEEEKAAAADVSAASAAAASVVVGWGGTQAGAGVARLAQCDVVDDCRSYAGVCVCVRALPRGVGMGDITDPIPRYYSYVQ
jgi:hypothetical protein